MPTKDLKEVKLYFRDEEGKPIESVASIGENLVFVKNTQGKTFPIQSIQDFSVTMELQPSSTKYLLVAIGEKRCVPNNWLKHHGIPMNRRR